LHRYSKKKDTRDYQKYIDSLKIPLGDRQARATLLSPTPNYDLAFEGFVKRGNHPQDIPGMIRLFIYFKNAPYMREAIGIWTEADKLIMQLQTIGTKLSKALASNKVEQVEHLLSSLDSLNNQLTQLEYDFSSTLSEGSRFFSQLLMWVSLSIFIVMLLSILIITRRIIKGIIKIENNLLISKNRFKSLYLYNMLGILDWHRDGRILDANNAFLKMLGYSARDISSGYLNWKKLTPEDYKARDQIALKQIEENGFCAPFEKVLLHKDGHRVPVYIGAALLNGEHEKGICFTVNQTEQKKAHTELKLSAIVFDSSSDGILIINQQKRVIKVNRAFCLMHNVKRDDVINSNVNDTLGTLPQGVWCSVSKTGSWKGDMVFQLFNGNDLHVCLSINAAREKCGVASHYVAILTDISERKMAEEQLRSMAHYDFLTGLANRNLLSEQIKTAIQRAKRYSTLFLIAFVDLDNFKPVNDTFGHEVGDMLLIEVGRRLAKIVRGNDTVARIGGDEFVLLMEELKGPESITTIINKIITEVTKPLLFGHHQLQVGCSVGISIYPKDGEDMNSLLQSADKAMYAFKEAGRNNDYLHL